MDNKHLKDLNDAYNSIYNQKQFKSWVGTLVEEGYDLSDYSWEELHEVYLEEALGSEFVQRGGIGGAIRRAQARAQKDGGASNRAWLGNKVKGFFDAQTRFVQRGGVQGAVQRAQARAQKDGGASNRAWLARQVGLGGSQTKPTPGTKPAPKPSGGTVLAKKGGVEGKLDKTTGKFTPSSFSSAEKSRYSSAGSSGGSGGPQGSAARPSGGSGGPQGSAARPSGGSGGPQGSAARPPAAPSGGAKVNPSSTTPPGKPAGSAMDQWAAANPKLAAAKTERDRTRGTSATTNPLMKDFKDKLPAPKTPSPTTAATGFAKNTPSLGSSSAAVQTGGSAASARPSTNQTTTAFSSPSLVQNKKTQPQQTVKSAYEWGTKRTLKDISDLYSSIYEGKKKDQDKDGDNDFADVRIARMIASGMSKAEAIAAVKNKEYNEEYELDEATRMRKELGKEGETATRKELAARSRAYKRSGSVDKTIAAAERGADRPYIKHKRDESDSDRRKREEKQSRTLRGLASARRGSVRGEGGLRGYAAKVEGSDKDLQSARGSARSAGTLTPAEKKKLGEEYKIYEMVASYLLENNFAETINDVNVIIENMSEKWILKILENI